jgi:hypothetical protein
MEKIIISEKSLLGTIAYWGCNQSPSGIPKNLIGVLNKVINILQDQWTTILGEGDFKCLDLASEEVEGWVHNLLFSIPEFEDWNLSENEVIANVRVSDPSRDRHLLVGRYIETPRADDFIDLDACVRNISRMLIETYNK